MTHLKDRLFRYCVLLGKRYAYKEKIAFLRVIAKELIPLGYHLDAKLAKLKLTHRRYENYYNGYIGDLNRADIIIATYYDTGIDYFNLIKRYAFQKGFSKRAYFIGMLPAVTLFIATLLLAVFVAIPVIHQTGFFNITGIISVLGLTLSFFLIAKYRTGIPTRNNFVCNSSTIILLLNLIQKLNPTCKKRIAFVLYDGGCANQFGLKMLESYDKKIGEKRVIFLDSIGNGKQLHFFKPSHFNYQQEGITFNHKEIETSFKKYILITTGEMNKEGEIEIKHAHSRKDNGLSQELIEDHTKSLHRLLMKMINAESAK